MSALLQRARVAFGASVVVALLATCDKEVASPKQAQAPPGASAKVLIAEAVSVELGDAVDDVLTRVVPVLGDADSVTQLRASLTGLRAAISSRDEGAIKSARTSLGSTVDAFANGDHDAVSADLAVVRLLLDQVDSAVGIPPADK